VFHANRTAPVQLSNKYWVDAFLTVVYIINRLPTPTLQNKSPYLKLYNCDLDYKKLRVFGCLCYPLLQPYNSHKLEYRSKPCIFLGYNYAGYKFLDPVTNKAYFSRHVIFNEESFPAKDQATSHFPSKINAQGDASVFFSVPIPIHNVLSHAPHTAAAIDNPISPSHIPISAPELPDLTPTLSSLPTLEPTPI
jgi:hypothetical protein